MNLLYAWLSSFLLLLGLFLWQAYETRHAAGHSHTSNDLTGWLLICMVLVAVLNFIILLIYLLPKL